MGRDEGAHLHTLISLLPPHRRLPRPLEHIELRRTIGVGHSEPLVSDFDDFVGVVVVGEGGFCVGVGVG